MGTLWAVATILYAFSFVALHPLLKPKFSEGGEVGVFMGLFMACITLGSGLNHDLFGNTPLGSCFPKFTIFCLAGIVINSGVFFLLMGIRRIRLYPMPSPKASEGFFQIITIINFIASVLGIVGFYLQHFK
jgi:hypothetical protein